MDEHVVYLTHTITDSRARSCKTHGSVCMSLSIRTQRPGRPCPFGNPCYGSAGADLFACIKEDVVIKSGKWAAIPTGIKIEMKKGMEAQIRPRSGLAVNYGITVLNSP